MDILNLDELKWHDDKTFRSACTAAGDNGKLPRHFGLAGQSLESLPPKIICRAELAKVIIVRERGDAEMDEDDAQFGGTFRCFEKQRRNETFLIPD
jgi:hypothetical protein